VWVTCLSATGGTTLTSQVRGPKAERKSAR
jgi:hypothetical protein